MLHNPEVASAIEPFAHGQTADILEYVLTAEGTETYRVGQTSRALGRVVSHCLSEAELLSTKSVLGEQEKYSTPPTTKLNEKNNVAATAIRHILGSGVYHGYYLTDIVGCIVAPEEQASIQVPPKDYTVIPTSIIGIRFSSEISRYSLGRRSTVAQPYITLQTAVYRRPPNTASQMSSLLSRFTILNSSDHHVERIFAELPSRPSQGSIPGTWKQY